MRRVAAAIALALIAIAAAGAAELLVRPGPLEQLRADRINANADAGEPIAMLWSIETYSDLLSVEGPRGAAAPAQVRIVRPDGGASAALPARTLDPAVHIGVCSQERPPLGTTWWSGQVPREMAEQLRSTGRTAWGLQAYVRERWVGVVLIDSGCRGIGRG